MKPCTQVDRCLMHLTTGGWWRLHVCNYNANHKVWTEISWPVEGLVIGRHVARSVLGSTGNGGANISLRRFVSQSTRMKICSKHQKNKNIWQLEHCTVGNVYSKSKKYIAVPRVNIFFHKALFWSSLIQHKHFSSLFTIKVWEL